MANHMFFHLALEGSRCVLKNEVIFAGQHLPKWNLISIVGQHIQQSGATPAEAKGFALSTAIQHSNDLVDRGLEPDAFLPCFTFFLIFPFTF